MFSFQVGLAECTVILGGWVVSEGMNCCVVFLGVKFVNLFFILFFRYSAFTVCSM